MKTIHLYALTLTAGLSSVGGTFAADVSRSEFAASEKGLSATYKSARLACKPLKANARDVCVEEAKAAKAIGSADLYATFKPTERNRYAASLVKANANYAVAKERCDDAAGNAKDVCRKEARAAQVSAKADATAKFEISKANLKAVAGSAKVRTEASKERAEARQDASSDKREAEYAVEKEKCDAMAGPAKDSCIAQAKARYGKS